MSDEVIVEEDIDELMKLKEQMDAAKEVVEVKGAK
jgi:hypothetical protein